MSAAPGAPDREAIRALPKVELHCHLDGAVRPSTLLELAARSGHRLPADTVESLVPHVQVAPGCRSLREFLATFETFYPVLAAPGALERVGVEVMHDLAEAGVVHGELRFCPHLQASEGHGPDAVVREALAGLSAGARETGVGFGAILCCYRPLAPETSEEVVDLALRHAADGVVGVDLAGPEDEPAAPHAPALARAREAGLPLTIHAGEAAGPGAVAEALDELAATRLGHAVSLARDRVLARRVAEAGVTVECCPTSNLHTGAVPSLAAHPLPTLREWGVPLALCTDDPRVSGVTLVDEYALAARQWALDLGALAALARAAIDAAFVDGATRARLHRRLEEHGG